MSSQNQNNPTAILIVLLIIFGLVAIALYVPPPYSAVETIESQAVAEETAVPTVETAAVNTPTREPTPDTGDATSESVIEDTAVQATAAPTVSNTPVPNSTPDPSGAAAGSLLTTWTQFVAGDETTAGSPLAPLISARFVLQGTGQACSDFSVTTYPSDAAAASTPEARTPVPAKLDFPITLCQFMMPTDVYSATLSTNSQPVKLWQEADGSGSATGPIAQFWGPASVGRKNNGELVMISMGDTGCRHVEKEGRGYQPDCGENSADWPFYALITEAAQQNPDLVVHVGDYRYRDEGIKPDTWNYWYQDIFHPAQDLMQVAPWALTRGNHEECVSRTGERTYYAYGIAYFYFFAPSISAAVEQCPTDTTGNIIGMVEDSWSFDVAIDSNGSPSLTHRFILWDSAASPRYVDNYTQTLETQFESAIDETLASSNGSVWWVSHRPLLRLFFYQNQWNYADDNKNEIMVALHNALDTKQAQFCQNGNCSPSVSISGHVHAQQFLTFLDDNGQMKEPLYVITGNGGVNAESPNDIISEPCSHDFPADTTPSQVARTGIVDTDFRHGFITWRRSANSADSHGGWSATPHYYERETYSFTTNSVPPACATPTP